MKINAHGFIGHSYTNVINHWDTTGEKITFEENLLTMPKDWYFRTAEISYKINSFGHRCKNIEEINLDNYILFSGCSHTEGAAMPLENTYPYLLSEKLNCDYYNLALGATGIDVVLHNLTIWFSVIKKKPKAVIIQWPDFTRTITGDQNNLQPRGLWNNDDDYTKFVNLGIDLNFFDAKKVMAHYSVQTMCSDIPVIYFGLQKVIPFNDDTIVKPIIDKARDLGHPGPKSHENFADAIYDHLINNECLNFYQNTEQKS